MNMIDIIEKKKNKESLTTEEIQYFIDGYTRDEIPDYQISALLMAIVLNDMNIDETVDLTNYMMYSGDLIDLSQIEGIKTDKHSTGGVGDKVSLILAPLLASANASVSKMSGRGLGHTGGTLDKLEAIPGFNISLSIEEFIKQVNEIKVSIIGQTGNLVPADKKMYALRDVSGTVQSIPLIASSIMSKKLACGADAILLDVKVGEGAFMKSIEDAKKLASVMVEIGKKLDKDVKAIITDMNQPLGHAIGNSLEVIEAVETLNGNGPKDLEEICLKLGSIMLVQAKEATDIKEAYDILANNLKNGKAFSKFRELVMAQSGDIRYIDDVSFFELSNNKIDIHARETGYLNKIHALKIGQLSLELGAGRHTKDDIIDYGAGIYLHKQLGNKVDKGDLLATLYTNKDDNDKFISMFEQAIEINENEIQQEKLIKEIIE